ncbi:putative kinase [Streptomyces olivoverticillatus]|uniref:Putative kinase n=1 Tax=Streptomyces olivoverticillatus TaxID=66427 RepID=A0A7W7PJU7_9ACTN|nr:putative kinase [Streptomyces olivoverticillatus]
MRTDVYAGVKGEGAAPPAAPVGVLDLRGGRIPATLVYPPGDLLVVSGLPGSGKSTLIRRTVAALDARGRVVHCVDSQDARERIERRTPPWLPYAVYRPLVRLAHYAALRRALRSDAGVVVHDCGQRAWVRRWLARDARRRGAEAHMLLLAVGPDLARAGQRSRGREVSPRAFRRHRRAMARLVDGVTNGQLPDGTASVAVLDRRGADALRLIDFG